VFGRKSYICYKIISDACFCQPVRESYRSGFLYFNLWSRRNFSKTADL